MTTVHPIYDEFLAEIAARLDEIGIKPEHKRSIHAEVVARLRERRSGRDFFEEVIHGFNIRRPEVILAIGVRDHKVAMREMLVSLPSAHPFFEVVAEELAKLQDAKGQLAKSGR